MGWTYGNYDWDDPVYMKKRDELADLIPELDEFFDEVREDNHEGSCWDLINGLAMVLTSKERSTKHNNVKGKE